MTRRNNIRSLIITRFKQKSSSNQDKFVFSDLRRIWHDVWKIIPVNLNGSSGTSRLRLNAVFDRCNLYVLHPFTSREQHIPAVIRVHTLPISFTYVMTSRGTYEKCMTLYNFPLPARTFNFDIKALSLCYMPLFKAHIGFNERKTIMTTFIAWAYW